MSADDCVHIWYQIGCEYCEKRGPAEHAALTDSEGVCYICGERHKDDARETRGSFGTFYYQGEAFVWGPDDSNIGLTVVLGGLDEMIALDRTPDLAVEKALYILRTITDIVDDFLDDMYGGQL